MKSNFEQFVNRDNTPEQSEKQTSAAPETIKEAIDEYFFSAIKALKVLSQQLSENLKNQTDFPCLEEQPKEEGMDLVSVLWNQLPEQRQKELGISSEDINFLLRLIAYGNELGEVLEGKNVDTSLLPYVLTELKKNKTLDPKELVKGNKLDRLITQARKTVLGKTLVSIPDHIYTLSSKQYRNVNTLIPIGKEIIYGRISGVFCFLDETKQTPEAIEEEVKIKSTLLHLFFSVRKESGKKSITLKTSEIINKIGIEPRNFCIDEKRLSRKEARITFTITLQKDLANMFGIIEGDTSFYSVLNFEKASLDGEYITFSSPYYERILMNMKANKSLNKCNNLLTKECYKLHSHVLEAFIGITDLILSRGTNTKEPPKILTEITYQRFLEDYTPHLWSHLNQQTTANRNATLKRVFGKLLGTKKTKSLLLNPVYCELTKRFQNVSISTEIPTWSRLGDVKISIAHHGKSKD